MTRMPKSLISIPLAILLLAGCSGENLPQTYAVTGVLTYKGQPVEGATVTLVPTSAAGRSSSGVTDSEGKFAVKTYLSPEHQPAGALPGDYSITVSKLEVREIPEGLTMQEAQMAFNKLGPPKNFLPNTYQSPNTSDLKVKVEDAAPEPLMLDLK